MLSRSSGPVFSWVWDLGGLLETLYFWLSRSDGARGTAFLASPRQCPGCWSLHHPLRGQVSQPSRCRPHSSRSNNSSSSEFVRITGFQTPSQRCWVRICIFKKCSQDIQVHMKKRYRDRHEQERQGLLKLTKRHVELRGSGYPPLQGTWPKSPCSKHWREGMHFSGVEKQVAGSEA